jgi:hypothetical protein
MYQPYFKMVEILALITFTIVSVQRAKYSETNNKILQFYCSYFYGIFFIFNYSISKVAQKNKM